LARFPHIGDLGVAFEGANIVDDVSEGVQLAGWK